MDKLRHGPSCAGCVSLGQDALCDRGQPCSTCAEAGSKCLYPSAPRLPPKSEDLDRLQCWPERAVLKTGSLSSARLRTQSNKRGQVARVRWEPVSQQRHDLRLKQNPDDATRAIYPPTIASEHETETVDIESDPLLGQTDAAILDTLTALLPREPFPPTLALRAVLDDRLSRSSQRSNRDLTPANINMVNCISSATIAMPSGPLAVSAWRRGDVCGRPCGIGFGHLDMKMDDIEENLPKKPPDPILFPQLPVVYATAAPIQQVQMSAVEQPGHALVAYRSATELHLSLMRVHDPVARTHGQIVSTFKYSGSMLRRRPMAHFDFGGISPAYGKRGSGFVVDAEGSLFGWGLNDGGLIGGNHGNLHQPEMYLLRKGTKRAEPGYSGFARVAHGGTRGLDAIVATENEVLLYDCRSSTSQSRLMDHETLSNDIPLDANGASIVVSLLERSPATVTSSDGLAATSTPSSLHPVATTRDVSWLDERMPGKVLLKWQHGRYGKGGRGSDRTLALLEVPPESDNDRTHRIALHSRIQPHVTMYTVSSTPQSHPVSTLDPYSISSPAADIPKPFCRVGLSILAPSRHQDIDSSWLTVDLGSDGAVYHRLLRASPETNEHGEDDGEQAPLETLWSDAMTTQYRAFSLALREPECLQGGVVGVREDVRRGLRDMSVARDAIAGAFLADEDDIRAVDSQVQRALAMVEGSLDQEQADSDPDPGCVTGLDLLAFTSRAARQGSFSADGVSPKLLDLSYRPTSSTHPTHVLLQEHELSDAVEKVSELDKQASTKMPYSALIFNAGEQRDGARDRQQLLAPNFASSSTSATELAETLKQRYGLSDVNDASISIRKDMAMACEELALDSMISSRVSSIRPLEPNPPPPVVNAAQPADVSPPPLHLSHIRIKGGAGITAVKSDDEDDEDPGTASWKKASILASGVRSLLGEWHMGSNPQSYVWSNPYADELAKDDPLGSQAAKVKSKKRRKDETANSNRISSSQVAPAIATSSLGSAPSFVNSQRPPALSSRRISRIQEDSSQTHQFSASQPAFMTNVSNPQDESQSGIAAASQIVPGAFGGRDREKKKKGKKRVSGF